MNLITRLLLLTISLTVLSAPRAVAQIVNTESEAPVNSDSIRRAFDSGPYFGLYKEIGRAHV